MSTARNTDFSNHDYRDVVNFYKELRGTLYSELREMYPGYISRAISLTDAFTANRWDSIDPGKGRDELNWINAYHYQSDKKRFKRFDLSVHNAGNLVGLAYGMPSQVKTQLKINMIEGTPHTEHKRNIRAFELISTAAQLYALLLGADEIRIMRPLNENVVKHYCSFGYEFVEPTGKNMPVYCSMKVEG